MTCDRCGYEDEQARQCGFCGMTLCSECSDIHANGEPPCCPSAKEWADYVVATQNYLRAIA